jgi:hypothetical protein
MAGKTDVFENDILKLIFNAIAIANLADNAASPLTNLYLSLHTADPGETAASGQSTNEAGGAYSTYTRMAVLRTSGGWVVTGNSVSPAGAVNFPQAPGGMVGSQVISHVGIGTLLTGNGKLLYSGALTPNITVAANVTPSITTSSTLTED